MNLQNLFLFFFSALGVFNGLIISIYFFFFKKPKTTSDNFFALMLLMLVFRIGKSVVFFFNRGVSLHFLQFGLTACFFIGPAVYFYLKSVVDPTYSSSNKWKIHGFILLVIATVVGVIYPYANYPNIWWDYIFKGIYHIWFLYLLLSGYVLKGLLKKLVTKSAKISALDFWLLSVYIGNFIIWIAYKTTHYTSYIVGALSFSFIFYLLFLLIHFNKKKFAIFSTTEKYSDKKISNVSELTQQLMQMMDKEQLFKNPNVKIKEVALKMGIPSHILSQLLNDNLGKSFALFINEYRVEEAKQLISKNDLYTLESIGFDAGFSSKSTFYASFKKVSGQTPAQFRKLLKA